MLSLNKSDFRLAMGRECSVKLCYGIIPWPVITVKPEIILAGMPNANLQLLCLEFAIITDNHPLKTIMHVWVDFI